MGNNLFAPDKMITRQEMFTLIHRTLALLDELPGDTAGKPMNSFSDANRVANYAKEAVAMFNQTGVISGSGGRLNPADTTSRAQMAQILYNLLSR